MKGSRKDQGYITRLWQGAIALAAVIMLFEIQWCPQVQQQEDDKLLPVSFA